MILSIINCTKLKYLAGGKLELFTKPLLMISLLLFYLYALKSNAPAPQNQWEIIITMVLYSLGDLGLIWRNKTRIFALGVLSFLIGHIFYAFFFIKLKISHHSLIAAFIAVAAMIPCIILVKRKLSKTDDPMADKMILYGFFLIFLIAAIASTYTGGCALGTSLALAGGLLFALSDSMIGIRATGQKIIPGESVMITYTAAQLLIVFGVLLLQI